MAIPQSQKSLEIPGRAVMSTGGGDLPQLDITTPWSKAGICLHGAHVTHFQKTDEPPVLFLSGSSRFQENAPIRGGIPIIFPWFGPRQGLPAHGFARTQTWELREISQLAGGEITVLLGLSASPAAIPFPAFSATYRVTVGRALTAELIVTNPPNAPDLNFENCLHTYFTVGEIGSVSVTGLKGAEFLDQTEKFARKTEQDEHIKIFRETDRIYLNTPSTVEIHDSKLRRRIRIEKTGSNSTVLWNPWVEKSRQLADFGDNEYQTMVCVESGNVNENRLVLRGGQSSVLKIELGTLPLPA